MKKNPITIASLTALVLSSVTSSVFAQESGFTTVGTLISTFTQTVVKSVGTLFIALAVVAFLFGIVQYIWGLREGDAKKVKDGNSFMIWGLVALFVMFSVYGIISLAQGVLFNGKLNNSIVIPEIKLSPKLTAPTQAPPGQSAPAQTLSGQGGGCTADTECQSGLTCYNGACTASLRPLVGQGGSCRINAECQSGLSCYNGVCTAPRPLVGQGGSCRIKAECQNGLSCTNGVCSAQ
jgi:hypothetical protein